MTGCKNLAEDHDAAISAQFAHHGDYCDLPANPPLHQCPEAAVQPD